MFRERIRAIDSWRRGPPRHDCVYVQHDPNKPGFRGLYVARLRHFFSIHHNKTHFPCALVSWYSTIDDNPCVDTGMWKVKPDIDNTGNLAMLIIHLDSMVRSAHLMGIADGTRIPHHLTFDRSLDAFKAFYVNKYVDHHAHEYAF
jgi:hypothetical protein